MSEKVLEQIKKDRLIAIARGISSQMIAEIAKALFEGGITCIEVAFQHESKESIKETLRCICRLKEELGDKLCVGAGTVMTAEQVREAVQAGAEYMISPGADRAVIEATKKYEKIAIPGALTPSEIANAWTWGADLVKVFPAGQLGSAYIKAVKAPLSHIPLLAVGGIKAENCADFIHAGAAGVGCGGNLVSEKLASAGRFEEIRDNARRYMEVLERI